MLSSVSTAYGAATPVVAAIPGATDVARTAPQTPKAPTYEERQERIAAQERPLLPEQDLPLDENGEEQETICVSSEFTTLGVLYDSIYAGLVPLLPVELQRRAPAAKEQAHRDMAAMQISRLAVSNHPMALGADQDDPALKYRDPLSQYIVVQLLNIRDGKAHEAISVENLTLAQAVETVWLYLYATVLRPVATGVAFLPGLGSPSTGVDQIDSLLGNNFYNTLIRLSVTFGNLGITRLYQATSTNLLNSCVARVTAEQRDSADQATEGVTIPVNIPQVIQDTADQVALADSETCAPIGSLPLSRIVTRTSEQIQSTMSNPADRAAIQAQERQLLATMRNARIHHHLIPADPSDFNEFESIASFIGNSIPYLGGAPLEILLGLGHNLGEGADFAETVSIADLTVTKSLTAAYYSYAIAVWMVSNAPLTSLLPDYADPVAWGQRAFAAIFALPMNYGLIVYHNVIRSMCFVEDDEGPTPGRGAQVNRDEYEGVEVGSTVSSSPSASTTPGSPSRSSAPSTTIPSTPASTAPSAPRVPAGDETVTTTTSVVPIGG